MNNLLYALTGIKTIVDTSSNFSYEEPIAIKDKLQFIRSIFHLNEKEYAIRMARAMQADHYIAMRLPDIDMDIQLRSELPDKQFEFEFSIKDTIEAYKDVPELFDILQAADVVDLFHLSDSVEEQYAIIGYAITKLVNYV